MHSLTDWNTRFPRIPQRGPFWCIPASIENMLRYVGFSSISQEDLVLGYCHRFREDALLEIVSYQPLEFAPVSLRGLDDADIVRLAQHAHLSMATLKHSPDQPMRMNSSSRPASR
jgi:hypothetical protein